MCEHVPKDKRPLFFVHAVSLETRLVPVTLLKELQRTYLKSSQITFIYRALFLLKATQSDLHKNNFNTVITRKMQ